MHWNPGEELDRVRTAQARPVWPKGATAGLVLLGATCIAIAMILYNVAGPRDVIGP